MTNTGKGSSEPVQWRLKKGLDRRFRAGHPWVYSNELINSPKGVAPGDPVDLLDSSGNFLARGYGNPQSLISFRALTRDPSVEFPLSPKNIELALNRARKLREQLGLENASYRLCFGEADGLPGLIVDRYLLAQDYGNGVGRSEVWVVQAHTAGMDRVIESIAWPENAAVVLRNDLSVRKLEGIEEEKPRVLRELPRTGVDLSDVQILVRSVQNAAPLKFYADLVKGQKTGFFLDQFSNIQIAAERFRNFKWSGDTLRILDLCCYVGQWSAQLGAVFKSQGKKVEVVAVDASARALEFAKRNVEAQGVGCETVVADVLKDLGQFPDRSFDLVISDPPALIKSRKDIPAGTHAYLQLATQALRLVRPGGGIVSCSCSALLEEEAFAQAQAKAALRNQRTVQWIARGSQAPDHPVLAEFPEGRYLKAWVGIL